MRAVIEYQSGDIGEIVGLSGAFGEFAERHVRERPDASKIWCVMDELGEKWDYNDEPYWTSDAAPFAVVETWRDGICDGRPETVTPYPDMPKAVRAAEIAWGYLTEQERKKYRVLVVKDYNGANWGRAEWVWDPEEGE